LAASTQLVLEVCDSLEQVSQQQWNSLELQGNPFVRHEFLRALEETRCLGKSTGWYPCYFLVKKVVADTDFTAGGDGNNDGSEPADDGQLIAACACYIKTNSYGEFVFDWAWADAYERHGQSYYPKLVAAIPFTPATGPRLLVRNGEDPELMVQLLKQAVVGYCSEQKMSSMHWLFVTEEQHDQLVGDAVLSRLDCQYHWHNRDYKNFEDFLAQCTSKRRKTIRRERRYVTDANIRLERRLGSTLDESEWALIYEFYCSTFDRKWGNPSLTLDFFKHIGRHFGDNCLIVFAYSDKPSAVAASVMFFGDDALYGRYWGASEDHHCLHFEACYYQGIEFAIERGITLFEPGAQGEHKITRGFEPTITRSAHWLADPGFAEAVGRYLKQERPMVLERQDGLQDMLPFRYTETETDTAATPVAPAAQQDVPDGPADKNEQKTAENHDPEPKPTAVLKQSNQSKADT